MSESTYRHFYGKALDAARGGYDAWRAQSTGERVSVALALNRADWLERIGYTKANRAERAALDNAQKAWVSFRNLDCATRTTSFPTSHAQYWNFACLTDRTLERRTHLEDYFQR